MRSKHSVLVLAVTAIVFAAPVARADDYAQIEKAKDHIGAADNFENNECYEKAEAELKAAEKDLEGVDETGKAEPVAKIKEVREKIDNSRKSWEAAGWKRRVERMISAAESQLEHDPNNTYNWDLADAMIHDSFSKSKADPAVIVELEKKLAWVKKKSQQSSMASEKSATEGALGRQFSGLDRIVEGAATTTDEQGYTRSSFKQQYKEIEENIAKHATALGDSAAEWNKRLATARETFTKNLGEGQNKDLERLVGLIQGAVDGTKPAYRENVEGYFKEAGERAPKCPQNDRTKALTTKLAELRKTFDGQVASADRDEAVKPVLDYWKYCQTEHAKDCAGWEEESKGNSLDEFLKSGEIGVPKTEKFLNQVCQNFFQDGRIERALKSHASDPELKKCLDEAKVGRDKATARLLAAANAIMDDAEKLPEGQQRGSMKNHFYNFKNTIQRACKGDPGVAKLEARVDALDKKWEGDKAAGEAAKEARWKECCEATEAAWPGLASGWLGKVKKLDANAAVNDINSWKGTVVHFDGGAHGVNMNRAGWDWMDDYAFVVSVDGVPVCGDLDGGVRDAVNKVCDQTGVAEDDLQECIGIVEGTCKATQRVKIFDQYVSGNTLTGVKIRIIAWKACTVCAVAGEGTNLSKLKGGSEISVSASGVSVSGGHGFGHFVHRLIAWFMCLVLFLSGALCAAHGASRFVPQIQENLAKMGKGLGYAGIGIAVVGALWFVAAIAFWVVAGNGGSLPSVAMVFAGAFVGLDFLRVRGTLKAETASMIQPVGIVLGLGCFAAALVHFLFWDWTLL